VSQKKLHKMFLSELRQTSSKFTSVENNVRSFKAQVHMYNIILQTSKFVEIRFSFKLN